MHVFNFGILEGNISAFNFNKRAKKSFLKPQHFVKKEVLIHYKYFRPWLNGDFDDVI